MDELENIRKKKMEQLIKKTGGSQMETEIEVDDNSFEKEVIERSKQIPVVVEFWAEGCPSCVVLAPLLEKLAKEYGGKFILAKVNVGDARTKAQEYWIMSIPAVKMFKDGKVFDEFVGALPASHIRKWLDKNLGGK